MSLEETSLRQEIKFYATTSEEALSFLDSIKRLPEFCNLYEVYQPRTICNIYFDSNHQDAQISSLEGYPKRSKIRARWYQPLHAEIHVALEQKIKLDTLGKKKIWPLFKCESGTDTQSIFGMIQHHLTPDTRFSFTSTLYNSYDRKYFSTTEGLRITVDSNILFSKIQNDLFEPLKPFLGYIIEVKVPSTFDATILRALPLTRTKISKFSLGNTYAR